MRVPKKLCRNKQHPMTVRNTKHTPDGPRCRLCIKDNQERTRRRRYPDLYKRVAPYICQVPQGHYAIMLAEAKAEFRVWDSTASRAARKQFPTVGRPKRQAA